MPRRKSNRAPASSASAAAAAAAVAASSTSSVPTFTSFAAATAQALGTDDASSDHALTQWDTDALALVKKLTKRDETTKQRILLQLAAHLHTFQNQTSSPFLPAWASVFPILALEDPSPSVRASALSLTADVVRTFARATASILPTLFPLWVSALGDPTPTVASAAAASLDLALPPPHKQNRAAIRYAPQLRDHCLPLPNKPDPIHASRVAAVLYWLLNTSDDLSLITPVIDHPSHPLRVIARALIRSQAPISTSFSQLAVDLVRRSTKSSHPDSQLRLHRLAEVAVLLARSGESLAWDIILLLLADAPHVAATVRDKIADALATALSKASPEALAALLPLIDAQPSEVGPTFAKRVLAPMRKKLLPNDDTPSVSYALLALPAYLETLTFVQNVAETRWVASGGVLDVNCNGWTEAFVTPVCLAYVSGVLPPISATSAAPRRVPQRKDQIAEAFGKLVRQISQEDASQVFPKFARALLSATSKRDVDGLLQRYTTLLHAIAHPELSRELVKATLLACTAIRESEQMVDGIRVLSAIVVTQSASFSNASAHEKDSVAEMVQHVTSFGRVVLENIVEGAPLRDLFQRISKLVVVIYSWVVCVDSIVNANGILPTFLKDVNTFFPSEERFELVSELLLAHKQTLGLDFFRPCALLQGMELEEIVYQATISAVSKDVSSSCIKLLSAAMDNRGGAQISVEKMAEVLKIIVTHVFDNPALANLDPVLLQLLDSSIQHMKALSDLFNQFFIVLLYRVLYSEAILNAALSRFETMSSNAMSTQVDQFLSDMERRHEVLIEDNKSMEVGIALAKILTALGEKEIDKSVTTSQTLMRWAPFQLKQAFLKHAPLQFIFGDGEKTRVRVEDFVGVLEQSFPDHGEISSLVSIFFNTLDHHVVSSVARSLSKIMLSGEHPGALPMLESLCALSVTNEYEGTHPLSAVANTIGDTIPKAGPSSVEEFIRVPQLVYTCMIASKGSFIEHLESTLVNIGNVVRRDPGTPSALIALETLSSALSFFVTQNPDVKQVWFQDLLLAVVRSIRRALEQPRGMSKTSIENLEEHCACLLYNCVAGGYSDVLSSDDVRFWKMRTRDSLEKYVQRIMSEGGGVAQTGQSRIGWLCKLGHSIVRSEGDIEDQIIDDICHWGAWAGVLLAPHLANLPSSLESVHRVDADGWAGLVESAAKRDVLLGGDGQLPCDEDVVYELVPLLSNKSAVVRRGVMVVVAFAGAILLPERLKADFPTYEFQDEAEELSFATGMIPKEIQLGLRWPTGEVTPEMEVGFFLCWRIFLDLVQIDEVYAGKDNGEEEVSFRRVGVTFLRADGDLVSEFFKRCLDVLVNGSAVERRVGASTAEEAVQAEEKPAHGAQLAKGTLKGTSTDKIGEKEEEEESSMEATVGRAAGIAFVRALQRIPAVSRSYIDKKVDRETWRRTEEFVRKWVSPVLIAAEVRRVREWGAFGGAGGDSEGEVHAVGSLNGREARATYTFSDVTLEIGFRLPDVFPLKTAVVEAHSKVGMSEVKWRRTMMGMTMGLQLRDGTLAGAVELWRRSLEKTFQGTEECPICYSVLHLSTAALPKMQCKTCKKLFHSDCLCKWFTKSNSSACPLCRSAFRTDRS